MSEKKTIISPINLRKDRLPLGQRWIEKPILYDISPNTDLRPLHGVLKDFG